MDGPRGMIALLLPLALVLAGCSLPLPQAPLSAMAQGAGCPDDVGDPCLRVVLEGRVHHLPWPTTGEAVWFPAADRDVEVPDRPTVVPTCDERTTARSAEWSMEMLDVGQADAILLESDAGHRVLVDTGRWTDDTAARDALLMRNITRLDALLITHPDADHAGGARPILEDVLVCTVVHPGVPADTRTWERVDEGIDRFAGAEVIARPGDALPGGLLVLAAGDPGGRGGFEGTNDASIVLHVPGPGGGAAGGALLMGDASCAIEDQVVRAWPDRVDVAVLKVGHHGSSTSSCPAFLEAATPEVALISVGHNDYGHPHREVLDLVPCVAQTYRTDRHGTVSVRLSVEGPVVTSTWPTPPVPCGGGTPVAQVSSLVCDAEGDDRQAPGGEEVLVLARRAVDLTGWRLEDAEARNRYVFDDGPVLERGQAVRVRSGPGPYEDARAWGGDAPVWNNDGDEAFLFDAAGALVDRRPCP